MGERDHVRGMARAPIGFIFSSRGMATAGGQRAVFFFFFRAAQKTRLTPRTFRRGLPIRSSPLGVRRRHAPRGRGGAALRHESRRHERSGRRGPSAFAVGMPRKVAKNRCARPRGWALMIAWLTAARPTRRPRLPHTCLHTCIHACVRTCAHTHVCTHVYAHAYAHMHAHVCMHVNAHAYAHAYQMSTRMSTHMCTHMSIHMSIHMPAHMPKTCQHTCPHRSAHLYMCR